MEGLAEVFRYVNALAFALLAVQAIRLWLRRRDSQSAWISLTFGVLGIIAVIGLFQPEEIDSEALELLVKFEIAVLVMFPYFLYRFAASFDPPGRTLELFAGALVGGVVAFTFLLPSIPGEGEERPRVFSLYIVALLIEWSALSLIMAVRLWRGGSDLPEVARRRTHLLSVAAGLLSLAIIISGSAGSEPEPVVDAITSVLTLISAVAFYFGFAPPRWVLMVWRRPAQDALFRGVTDLVSAETEQDVTQSFLPHVTAIVGGRAVALVEEGETILDSHGASPDMLERVPQVLAEPEREHEGVIVVPLPFATVIVWTSTFAPFFGEEEVELVRTLGTLGHFALERTRATRLKAELADAQRRREQALQINDNVVQGLAVAKYSFEMGLTDKARDAVDRTLSAARTIISDLLEELGGGTELEPGALVRHEPAGFDPPATSGERQ